MKEHPICLISYSWDDQEHKDWVRRLADDLRSEYSIDVQLDQYELQAGAEPLYFMERNVEHADKVLLILTPGYKAKAAERRGGVGAEWSMISQGIYTAQTANDKFIPVLRKGTLETSAPVFLQSRLYHSMLEDANYAVQLHELARLIREVPLLVKPALGPVPDFDAPGTDPLLRQMKELANAQALNARLDGLLDSPEGLEMASTEAHNLLMAIQAKADLYNSQSDVDIRFYVEQNDRACVIGSGKTATVLSWEPVYRNSLSGSALQVAQWSGRPSLRSGGFHFPPEAPKKLRSEPWTFDLDLEGKPVWKNSSGETKTKDEMVSAVFYRIIAHITDQRTPTFRS